MFEPADRELPGQPLDTVPHSLKPHPTVSAAFKLRGDSAPIVANAELDHFVPDCQADIDPYGTGVAVDIRQGLLRDAKQRNRDWSICDAPLAAIIERHGKPRPYPEAARQILECRAEPFVTDRGRIMSKGKGPDLAIDLQCSLFNFGKGFVFGDRPMHLLQVGNAKPKCQ